MRYIRQINNQTLLLLSLLLSITLLCAQGIQLHAHDLDHSHNEHLDHSHAVNNAIDPVHGHMHQSKIHYSLDSSHNEHHDNDIASDIDISPDGLFKKISISILALAVITFVFLIVVFTSSQKSVFPHRNSQLSPRKYFLCSPPLRAPPQH